VVGIITTVLQGGDQLLGEQEKEST